MNLTSDIIYGFSNSLLAKNFDNPLPTPDFHFELWELCCKKDKLVAIAAPREHAKSTAVTHAFVLASALFMIKQNIMILSDTETQAKQYLLDIKLELEENQELRNYFHINHFVRDKEHDLIVSMGPDHHQFRIFTKASGQSLRGSKWRSKRPDLIIGDDLENDEMVESAERRVKLKKWLLAALIPCLSDKGQIRIVGTILHSDSLLEYCLNSTQWTSKRYAAHNKNFSEILWESKFPKERLLSIREVFEEAGELDIYSREYLNIPINESTSLFRKSDFSPIKDRGEILEYYVGGDFAISTKTSADFTVFVVIGVNKAGKKKVVDVVRGRFDTLGIIDKIFDLYTQYKPQYFVFEDENINKALGPVLYSEMEKRKLYPLIELLRPARDKIVRARPLIAATRAKQVEYDMDADWWPDFLIEMLQFPRGKKDDQVDSLGIIFLHLHKLFEAQENPTSLEEEFEEEYDDEYYTEDYESGRNQITGY